MKQLKQINKEYGNILTWDEYVYYVICGKSGPMNYSKCLNIPNNDTISKIFIIDDIIKPDNSRFNYNKCECNYGYNNSSIK